MAKKPVDEDKELETAKPVDFSFKKFKVLKAVGTEGARQSRIGKIPERGSEHRKFLTRSVWLNNNKLSSIKNMDALVNSILEQPEKLGWIDFSFNYITDIDESILKFPNLKIIYFHGNLMKDLDEILKLRQLKQLRSVTFHGNPMADNTKYRSYAIAALPQIVNLDFCPVVKTERLMPAPPEVLRKVQETSGVPKEEAVKTN